MQKKNIFKRLFSIFLSERGQVIFAVLLLILIPIALVINTLIVISSAHGNMDIELQRKALLAQKVFQATTTNIIEDQEAVQDVIEKLAESSEEVWGIEILVPDGEEFVVFATLKEDELGSRSKALNNFISWLEEKTIAFQTLSSEIVEIGEEIRTSETDQRFWVVVTPLYNENGDKTAILSMKFSSKIIDDLVSDSVSQAVIILVVTVGIIILLLVSNAKLFQFAVLFRKLKEVDKMKDEFISIASHELRTPITAIRGYMEMLLDGSFGPISDKAKEAMTVTDSAVERLNILVEDLLNVSRIEQGRLEVEMKDNEVLPVINEVIAELKPLAKEKNLQLHYVGEENLPNLVVDRDRFKQVIINLIGNSIKYTFKGKVDIESEINNDKLKITISDTGIGMSTKDRERLFSKFYRIQNEHTKDVGGTGLGLWITNQIVEIMKGEIEVESMEGVGSKFAIQFPISKKKSN